MNDRDALIKDASEFANFQERQGSLKAAEMVRALISLASPSPAQWPEDKISEARRAALGFMRGEGFSGGWDNAGLVDAIIAALATPPPPEDERVGRLVEALRNFVRLHEHGFVDRRDFAAFVAEARSALASYRGGK